MKMKRKAAAIGISIALGLSAAACAKPAAPAEQAVQPEAAQPVVEKVYNEDLSKKVQKEDGVTTGEVFTQDDMAIATIVLDKNTSDKKGKALANEYAEALKDQYKDKKVVVLAVRDGKTVASIIKE